MGVLTGDVQVASCLEASVSLLESRRMHEAIYLSA